jgi:hypothetical protein
MKAKDPNRTQDQRVARFSATTIDRLAEEIRWMRYRKEIEDLPPIPPRLLSLDKAKDKRAIASVQTPFGWLNLRVAFEAWPVYLQDAYGQDLAYLFSSSEAPGTEVQPVVPCQSLRFCPRKGERMEDRSCPFYCHGVCALATLAGRAGTTEVGLPYGAIARYIGLSRQRTNEIGAEAQKYLEEKIAQSQVFQELLARTGKASRVQPPEGP